jgi:hypothetical protein
MNFNVTIKLNGKVNTIIIKNTGNPPTKQVDKICNLTSKNVGEL